MARQYNGDYIVPKINDSTHSLAQLYIFPLTNSIGSKVRTTNPGEGVQLVMGKSGLEAAEPMTVGKMFQETVARFPEHPALRHKEGEDWQTLTYREYYSSSLRAAKSFLKVCPCSGYHDNRCIVPQ